MRDAHEICIEKKKKKKKRLHSELEEMFRIYPCYRYARNEDDTIRGGSRGGVTIDDLWTIAWSVSGGLMAGLHAATGASDVEYSRVQFRRIPLALRRD